MKVLYAAFRHDPRDPMKASGVDYNFYSAIKREGMDVKIVGPFPGPFPRYEHAIRKLYMKITGKRYMKWDFTSTWKASHAVNRAVETWQPDVVFTIHPPPLFLYDRAVPCVFNTDLSFKQWQEAGAGFGKLALRIQAFMERRAVRKSARVITFGEECKAYLVKEHDVSERRIVVMPMPSALPLGSVPASVDVRREKALGEPLRLLLVGRTFARKGVDIAMETVHLLNEQGIAAALTVCGTEGPEQPNVRFVGPYDKTVPEELQQYLDLYRKAHLLIHPARFEAAGIVPGEAAAFATPTITNDAPGGLSTTVAHEVSGLVLPRLCGPEVYASHIKKLVQDPQRYYALCERTRARYEQELNWEVASKRVAGILLDAAGKA